MIALNAPSDLLFRRSKRGRLKVDGRVVQRLCAWRQTAADAPESGGVLIGRWLIDGDDVVIDDLTSPSARDSASRTGFFRSRAPHQAALDRAWRESRGTQTWLGEWHTHPEANPHPSAVDRAGWMKCLTQARAPGDSLFFVIVGLAEIRVWEGRRRDRAFVELHPFSVGRLTAARGERTTDEEDPPPRKNSAQPPTRPPCTGERRAWAGLAPAAQRAHTEVSLMPQTLPPTRWELEFETCSPLFLGGAEPNERAELRAPSLRGALRAWYRLLVGPKIAARGLEDGRFSESSIFGGTASGEGQGRVLLHLPDPPQAGQTPWDAQARGREGPGAGRAYLGYTLNFGDNRRKSIPERTRFRVQAVHPCGLPDDEGALLAACWWMFGALGGLGTRARRGFGSLTATRWPPLVTRYDGQPAELPGPRLPDLRATTSKSALGRALSEGLFAIWDHARPREKAGEAKWALTHPVYRLDKDSRFVIWGPDGDRGWRDGWEALDAVGRAMAGFRKRPGIDGLGTSTLGELARTGTLPKAPARASFGLPLTYRDLRGGRSYELRPHVPTQDGGPERTTAARQPSPLLISLLRTEGGVFALLTRVSGDLPGVHVDLAVQGRDRGFIPSAPAAQAVDRFLDELPARKEVRL